MGDAFDMNAAPMRIGRVRLKVRDLDRVARFYADVIGLAPIEAGAHSMTLGAGGTPLLDLLGDPAYGARDPRQAGLFHTAFLVPSRADLSRWLAFAAARGIALLGASDHRVSEAIYLADPEGNGIEVYADRPRTEWVRRGEFLDMPSVPLDLAGLLRAGAGGAWAGMPAGGRIGHMHLQVGEIGAAERFYAGVLGFELTCRYPGGSFFGAGGYHHQLGANVWNSRGAGITPEDSAGLDRFEIRLNDRAALDAIETRATAAGLAPTFEADGLLLRDPFGTAVVLRAG